MKGLSSILIFLLLCASACTHKETFCSFRSLKESNWHKDSVLRFDVPVTDSLSALDVLIEIRNTNDYPYKNLWLFVHCTTPSGESRRDTVECLLADDFGKWQGKGLSLFELAIPYEQNIRYPRTGTYSYRIKQAMRDDVLKGISDVGLKVIRK